MKKAYCPVNGCDYWITFDGHLKPFLAGLFKHYKSHTELPYSHLREPGGMLDQIIGDAIVERLKR